MDTIITSSVPTQVPTDSENQKVENTNKLEKVSFIVLLITIILSPLAFVPSLFVSLDFVKTVVITSGVLLSALLYLISCFKTRTLSFPKHTLVSISCGIVLSLIISTFLSPSIGKSFFGQGFEISTVSFLFVLFLGSLLTVYLTHKDRDRVVYVFAVVFGVFIIVALFEILRLIFGANFISLGVFQSVSSTMLGKWNDIGILSALIGILSYVSLRFLTLSRSFKVSLTILSVISLLGVLLVDSTLIWGAAFVIFAFIVWYEYSSSSLQTKGIQTFFKKVPVITTIILAVIAIGIWKGDSIIKPSLTKLNISSNEVILPWQLTLDVAADTIKESPFFGAGPNRFMSQYLKFKPLVVNPTIYWSTEFNNGFGFIPSFVVTQGAVGFVLWLLLVIAFVYTGCKALKVKGDMLSRFFILSTFFSSLFLWIIALVYLPSHATLFMTFIFSGLFVATLVHEGHIPLVKLGQNSQSARKALPVIFIILIAITVLWLAVSIKKQIAITYFQSGISSLSLPNNQGLVKAQNSFAKALSLDRTDTYYQAMSEANILKVNVVSQQVQDQVQKTGGKPDPDMIKQISMLIDQAVGYTREAVKIDPTNYYNYVAEARISEAAVSLQIPNAYENAKNAYTSAIANNPYNPALYLSVARLDASQNKLDEAKKDIGLALQLKQNYIDAIFLLSQIQVSQGQIKNAIDSTQAASQINPSNPLIFFQLGLLYYNDKDYQGAVDALNQALKLDNKYANAQYFLGLSYARLNKTSDAIIQFENLAKTNPDNKEVAFILSNLRAGKSPFNDAKPPIDSKPEKRNTLPIKGK